VMSGSFSSSSVVCSLYLFRLWGRWSFLPWLLF
jgi:hypothetical protein